MVWIGQARCCERYKKEKNRAQRSLLDHNHQIIKPEIDSSFSTFINSTTAPMVRRKPKKLDVQMAKMQVARQVDLPPEILLPIFKTLDSREMVCMMRVSKSWLEVIEENQSLWRRLILPKKEKEDEEENEWEPSVLELWDQKTSSSLQEVSIHVQLEQKDLEPFVQTLERSKETLQILSITPKFLFRYYYALTDADKTRCKPLFELLWKLPSLVDFRILKDRDRPESVEWVHLKGNKVAKRDRDVSGLKILWLPPIGDTLNRALMDSEFLHNLVSMDISLEATSSMWRQILDRAAKTLRHLSINLVLSEWEYGPVQALEFTQLTVLIINGIEPLTNKTVAFPSWMIIPSSGLINCRRISSLPSISSVWIRGVAPFESLGITCPELEEMRLYAYDRSKMGRAALFGNVVSVLHHRKENVDAGWEANGVKMIQLKRLGVWFYSFSPDQLTWIRGLVGELFDLATCSDVVEVEVDI